MKTCGGIANAGVAAIAAALKALAKKAARNMAAAQKRGNGISVSRLGAAAAWRSMLEEWRQQRGGDAINGSIRQRNAACALGSSGIARIARRSFSGKSRIGEKRRARGGYQQSMSRCWRVAHRALRASQRRAGAQ